MMTKRLRRSQTVKNRMIHMIVCITSPNQSQLSDASLECRGALSKQTQGCLRGNKWVNQERIAVVLSSSLTKLVLSRT